MSKFSGKTLNKALGQHFLTQPDIIERLVACFDPTSEDVVIEIGAGAGILTTQLLPRVRTLIAIEIDARWVTHLMERFKDTAHFTLLHQDALRCAWPELLSQTGRAVRLIGNLPYQISSPLLFQLAPHLSHVQDLYFLLQKEVVDRLVAVPSTKAYGRLSVVWQALCHMQRVLEVPPTAFHPPPEVDSTVIHLRPIHRPASWPPMPDLAFFCAVVQQAFSTRRKTLLNNFKSIPFSMHAADWQLLDIDPQRRAETLTVPDFLRLASFLASEQDFQPSPLQKGP